MDAAAAPPPVVAEVGTPTRPTAPAAETPPPSTPPAGAYYLASPNGPREGSSTPLPPGSPPPAAAIAADATAVQHLPPSQVPLATASQLLLPPSVPRNGRHVRQSSSIDESGGGGAAAADHASVAASSSGGGHHRSLSRQGSRTRAASETPGRHTYVDAEVQDLMTTVKRLERENSSLNHSLETVCGDNLRISSVLTTVQQQLALALRQPLGESLLAVLFDAPKARGFFGGGKEKPDEKERRERMRELCDGLQREYMDYRADHATANDEVQSLLVSLQNAHKTLQEHSKAFGAAQREKRPITLNCIDATLEVENDALLDEVDTLKNKVAELSESHRAAEALILELRDSLREQSEWADRDAVKKQLLLDEREAELAAAQASILDLQGKALATRQAAAHAKEEEAQATQKWVAARIKECDAAWLSDKQALLSEVAATRSTWFEALNAWRTEAAGAADSGHRRLLEQLAAAEDTIGALQHDLGREKDARQHVAAELARTVQELSAISAAAAAAESTRRTEEQNDVTRPRRTAETALSQSLVDSALTTGSALRDETVAALQQLRADVSGALKAMQTKKTEDEDRAEQLKKRIDTAVALAEKRKDAEHAKDVSQLQLALVTAKETIAEFEGEMARSFSAAKFAAHDAELHRLADENSLLKERLADVGRPEEAQAAAAAPPGSASPAQPAALGVHVAPPPALLIERHTSDHDQQVKLGAAAEEQQPLQRELQDLRVEAETLKISLMAVCEERDALQKALTEQMSDKANDEGVAAEREAGAATRRQQEEEQLLAARTAASAASAQLAVERKSAVEAAAALESMRHQFAEAQRNFQATEGRLTEDHRAAMGMAVDANHRAEELAIRVASLEQSLETSESERKNAVTLLTAAAATAAPQTSPVTASASPPATVASPSVAPTSSSSSAAAPQPAALPLPAPPTSASSSLDQVQLERDTLVLERQGLLRRIEALTAGFTPPQKTVVMLETDLASCKAELLTLSKSLAVTKKRLHDVERDHQEKASAMMDTNKELAATRKECDTAKKLLQSHEKRLRLSETTSRDAVLAREALVTELAQCKEDLALTKQVNSHLAAETAAAAATTSALRPATPPPPAVVAPPPGAAATADLQQRLSALESECQKTRTECMMAQSQLKEAQETIARLNRSTPAITVTATDADRRSSSGTVRPVTLLPPPPSHPPPAPPTSEAAAAATESAHEWHRRYDDAADALNRVVMERDEFRRRLEAIAASGLPAEALADDNNNVGMRDAETASNATSHGNKSTVSSTAVGRRATTTTSRSTPTEGGSTSRPKASSGPSAGRRKSALDDADDSDNDINAAARRNNTATKPMGGSTASLKGLSGSTARPARTSDRSSSSSNAMAATLALQDAQLNAAVACVDRTLSELCTCLAGIRMPLPGGATGVSRPSVEERCAQLDKATSLVSLALHSAIRDLDKASRAADAFAAEEQTAAQLVDARRQVDALKLERTKLLQQLKDACEERDRCFSQQQLTTATTTSSSRDTTSGTRLASVELELQQQLRRSVDLEQQLKERSEQLARLQFAHDRRGGGASNGEGGGRSTPSSAIAPTDYSPREGPPAPSDADVAAKLKAALRAQKALEDELARRDADRAETYQTSQLLSQDCAKKVSKAEKHAKDAKAEVHRLEAEVTRILDDLLPTKMKLVEFMAFVDRLGVSYPFPPEAEKAAEVQIRVASVGAAARGRTATTRAGAATTGPAVTTAKSSAAARTAGSGYRPPSSSAAARTATTSSSAAALSDDDAN